MWSSLAVYKPRRDHIPTIFSWLECARQSPLSLYLHAPAGDNFEDQRAIAYILGFFLDSQRERQIKHITLKLAGEFPISVSPFFGSSTPRLKSVELDLHGPQDTMHVWRAFCNVGIPQVWWRPSGVLHTLPSMPWEALTRLRLPIATNEAGVSMTDLMKALLYCDRLVDLEIAMKMPLVDTFPSSNSPYTTEQYAGALLCLREYRKRTLPSEEYVMDSASLEMALSGPIDLPRLRHFKVQAHGRDSTPLLNRLSARNLTSLRIAHFNKDESTSPSTMDGIISLLERSQAQLTSLSIFDSKMPKSETVKLISCPQVVGLRSLELLIGPVGHSVLHPLTFTRKKRCMPGLRKLVLPGCIVKQGFLSGMLKSRRTTLQELTFTTARVTKELYQELSDMRRIAAESRVLLTID
ncbi:hypothetical protein DXG01_016624 [Tephrocybe rancida]|nr:hypothetical protein DXG01_016624 [Tephrocybe rancida]